MFNRLAAGIAVGAFIALMAAPAACTKHLFGWSTGGAAWISNSPAFLNFLETGHIADRSLLAIIRNSGWTADERPFRHRLVIRFDLDWTSVSNWLCPFRTQFDDVFGTGKILRSS